MSPYRYRVSLRATHPSADLVPLFEDLGLTPVRTWRAGQPRRTPRGTPLEGFYRDSYGYADLTPGDQARDWSNEHIEDFLHRILQRLSTHQDSLAAFSARGGRCGLFIGLFGERTFGFELSPELSAASAQLRLTLAFDIQPDSDD